MKKLYVIRMKDMGYDYFYDFQKDDWFASMVNASFGASRSLLQAGLNNLMKQQPKDRFVQRAEVVELQIQIVE